MDKAISHLKKDPVLRRIIEENKMEELDVKVNLFEDLIEAIINQQLSGKAATTIFNRFKKLYRGGLLSAENILKTPDEKIRACGISYSKIKYIKGICEAIKNGLLSIDKVQALNDEEVIIELTKLKGVGRWTAEMILIFSLKRPDVFSVGDLGLRNAVSRHYKVDKNNLKKIEKISLTWSPYRSYASRLLWRSLNNRPLVEK